MASDRTTGSSSTGSCNSCRVSVKNAWLRWVLVIIWMAVIFRASATPDLRAVPWAQRFHLLPRLMGPEATNLLEFLLRKGAHMAVFGILAGLGLWALQGVLPLWRRNRLTAIAFAIALLYAVSDEWHQHFVPTRQGTPRDVVIDAAGAAVALFFIGWRYSLGRRRTFR
jgi:VanZ family protein